MKPGHLSKLGPALFSYYRVVEKRPSPSFAVASPGVVVTTIAAVPTGNRVNSYEAHDLQQYGSPVNHHTEEGVGHLLVANRK